MVGDKVSNVCKDLCVYSTGHRTSFDQEWQKVQTAAKGDFSFRELISYKSRTPTADLLSDLDQLMVEKWEQSDKTLWVLNQIIYAAAKAAYKKQAKRGTAMPEVNLNERVEMK